MPTYESYVTNTKKAGVARRGLNSGGKKAKGTSYASPPKRKRAAAKNQRAARGQAAAVGRGARMKPLADAWAQFLRSHGLNRTPLNRSFPGIKPRVVSAIKYGGIGGHPHQDELDYSKASLAELVALARKISKDPDATAAQARQAAKYATELADIKSQVGRVTINPKSSSKETGMTTRNGPRAKRKRRAEGRQAKKKTSSKGLDKARAIRGAMALGVSKDTANRLYDAGKITDTGHPKKGARDVPKGMKEASKKKKAPAKTAKKTAKKKAKKKTSKKKAKKRTKAVAKRKTTKPAKRKKVKRAPPTPRKKGSARPIKVKRRGTAPTRGCKRAKPGAQSVASAARRVQAGQEGMSGTPLAYERWCRNFANVEKFSEADLEQFT